MVVQVYNLTNSDKVSYSDILPERAVVVAHLQLIDNNYNSGQYEKEIFKRIHKVVIGKRSVSYSDMCCVIPDNDSPENIRARIRDIFVSKEYFNMFSSTLSFDMLTLYAEILLETIHLREESYRNDKGEYSKTYKEAAVIVCENKDTHPLFPELIDMSLNNMFGDIVAWAENVVKLNKGQ